MYFLTSLPLPIPFDPLSLPLNFSTWMQIIHHQHGCKSFIINLSANILSFIINLGRKLIIIHWPGWKTFWLLSVLITNITNQESPITNNPSSTANHQLPITIHQTPITKHQSPTTNHKYHQSPTLNITNHKYHQSPQWSSSPDCPFCFEAQRQLLLRTSADFFAPPSLQ